MGQVDEEPKQHLLRGVLACPTCGSDVLEAVSDGEDTNFLCLGCWACWHWDLGYLIPVSAATCPGCQHRDECLRRRDAAAAEEERSRTSARTPVWRVMAAPPVMVGPELSLRAVARCLREAKIGAAVVVEGGRVKGMISERDVVTALADGADVDTVWAADVMTPEPVWAEPDDPVERAMELMLTAGIRHLPVIAGSALIGMLSLRDIVRVAGAGAFRGGAPARSPSGGRT